MEPGAALEKLPQTVSQALPATRVLPPADRNPVATYLASLSPTGRRTMAQALGLVASKLTTGTETAATMNWSAVGYQHVQALRSWLMESYRPATANKILAAVRRVLRECWRLGHTTAEHYHSAASVEGVKSTTIPRGRMLSISEILDLRQVCDTKTAGGVRDAALLAVMSRGGLRRAEVVALDIDDFSETDGGQGTLVVEGKGRKQRLVPLANGALAALQAWVSLRGEEPGPLFLPVTKGGVIGSKRMTTQAIYNTLRRVAKRAGVADFSPHDLRRTAGSEMLDAGADLAVVADILGHSSVDVTRRSYDRRGERAARKAAALVNFPF